MIMQNVVRCGSAMLPTLIITCVILIKLSIHQNVACNTSNQTNQPHIQMISARFVRISDRQARTGYITSENYPDMFPINSSSLLSLEISHNLALDTIKLTFEDLNLHISNHCESEALAILLGTGFREDMDIRTRKIFVICGTTIPQPVIVSTQNLLLHFESDEFNRGDKRGFRIKYEFLDGRQLYGGCDRPAMFKCRNRKCIPNHLVCDHKDDCGDASDEDRLTPCDNLPTINYGINYLCGWSRTPNNGLDSGLIAQSSVRLQNRIVGGSKVNDKSSLPFQVSIQTMRIETLSHICGGTLIHPMFVLSAAHCFSGFIPSSDYKFLFGVEDLKQAYSESLANKTQVRYAASIKLYPGGAYSSDFGSRMRHIDMTHDLALVELNAPVRMTNHVWPACLPHLDERMVANLECQVSGYGETRGTGDLFVLKKVKQIIQHISGCVSDHEEFEVDDHSMICAKSLIDNGPCNGDSGGPLFCSHTANNTVLSEDYSEEMPLKPGDLINYLPIGESKSTQLRSSKINTRARYTVHGVTSFTTDGNFGGSFCGLDRVPTVYARISPKVDWILAQMKMAMPRLSRDDNRQNQNNRSGLFGYMFRTGVSRHKNHTQEMTINSTPVN